MQQKIFVHYLIKCFKKKYSRQGRPCNKPSTNVTQKNFAKLSKSLASPSKLSILLWNLIPYKHVLTGAIAE